MRQVTIARDLAPELLRAAAQMPSVTVTGPRQSGKTTLCRMLFPSHPYVTLEAPDARAFAETDARGFLAQFPQGAVLDEVQRVPDLLSYLQGMIDDDGTPGRWILSGSQNLSLLGSVSQSLAGRTAVYHLLPLALGEIRRFENPPGSIEEALHAGAYPRIFDRNLEAPGWLRSYVATYLERDVRALKNVGDLVTFQRFLELCAGRTGQMINYSSLAGDCGVSQPTAKAWLSILEASFIVFRLPAFHRNIRKRLVKVPKLYFHDTGLACWLLGIREPGQVRSHPLRGAIFETWVVSEIVKNRMNLGESGGLTYFRDRSGAEVDLVIEHADGLRLVEAKSSATPSRSLLARAGRTRRLFSDLPGDCSMQVVYGGDEYQQRADGDLVPWTMARGVGMRSAELSLTVFANDRPVADADVLGVVPNADCKHAVTNASGEARFQLHTPYRPVTVYVAAGGFAAHVEQEWIPAERALPVTLKPLSDGGAVLFPNGEGEVPALKGLLKVSSDAHRRKYLRADRVAVNGGERQPYRFDLGEEVHLAGSDGRERIVRVVDIAGPSALLEYRRVSGGGVD